MDCYETRTPAKRRIKIHRLPDPDNPKLWKCQCGNFQLSVATPTRIEWLDDKEKNNVCYLSIACDAWVHKLPPDFKPPPGCWEISCACGNRILSDKQTVVVDWDTLNNEKKVIVKEPKEERPSTAIVGPINRPVTFVGSEMSDLFNEENSACV